MMMLGVGRTWSFVMNNSKGTAACTILRMTMWQYRHLEDGVGCEMEQTRVTWDRKLENQRYCSTVWLCDDLFEQKCIG